MPIATLTVPPISPPASVMPRCSGQSTASASCMIGRDGEEHVAGLHRHLVFVEIVVLQQLDVIERAFDQRVGAGLAVFFEQVLLKAAGVDADADRAAVGLGRADHFGDAFAAADIAGIDPQAGRARVGGFERALVVEMDVGDRSAPARRGRSRASAAVLSSSGQETRIMSAPGFLAAADLVDRRRRIRGQRVGHGLDRDRRIAADRHVADHDLAGFAARDIAPGPNEKTWPEI